MPRTHHNAFNPDAWLWEATHRGYGVKLDAVSEREWPQLSFQNPRAGQRPGNLELWSEYRNHENVIYAFLLAHYYAERGAYQGDYGIH
jgi:hypothetical protein